MAAPNDEAARRLYLAVAESRGKDEVHAAIEACAPPGSVAGSSSSSSMTTSHRARVLAAALNRAEPNERNDGRGETPLQAAPRLRRGDLIGLLLEFGADVATIYHDPLALCIAYGQAESLRALAIARGVDLREKYGKNDCHDDPYYGNAQCSYDGRSSYVHLCMIPLPLALGVPPLPPQLECLRVLVQEFGADINARDHHRNTPLLMLWRCKVQPEVRDKALDLLVSLGADVNARGGYYDTTLIYSYACGYSLPSLLRLLGHGAVVDIINNRGETPLMWACSCAEPIGELVMELLHRYSVAAWRLKVPWSGSALDYLVHVVSQRSRSSGNKTQQWPRCCAWAFPFLAGEASVLLPIAATLMQQQEIDLYLFQSGRMWDWRGHEAMVHLALQDEEARFDERRVAERKAEVARLEAELRALVGEEEREEKEKKKKKEEKKQQKKKARKEKKDKERRK
jgi:ankyrin repeat protein